MRLTDDERDSGTVSPDTLARARSSFDEQGLVIIDNLLPRALVERLRDAYFTRYGGWGYDSVMGRQYPTGPGRVIHPVRIAAPFDEPALWGNGFVCQLLRAALGDAVVLNSFSAVVAAPGAPAQRQHRDYELLFGEDELSLRTPPFAVTLGVPLVDLTDETGTTAMHPGTHRTLLRPGDAPQSAASHPLLEMGGAYFMDYRLLHHGTANRGASARPILYLVYARSWWIDSGNYMEHNLPSLVIDDDTLARVPPDLAGLLLRARVPVRVGGGFFRHRDL
jgi:hypothetical protein